MMSVETNQKINLLAEEDLAQGTESRKKIKYVYKESL